MVLVVRLVAALASSSGKGRGRGRGRGRGKIRGFTKETIEVLDNLHNPVVRSPQVKRLRSGKELQTQL